VTKGKPDQSQERKTTGPRFLREAIDDSPKDPKTARLPKPSKPSVPDTETAVDKVGIENYTQSQT